jgi:uncharacterized membrane protein
MDIVKNVISLVFYIEQDKSHAKPYWLDPTVIALVVSLLATALARWAGMDIDADLQLKIVGAITGIGALLSPHTGIVNRPAAPNPLDEARRAAQKVREANLSNLS